jgi:putative resolvase
MNLSDWAERVGVSNFTAYRWFREDTLPVPAQKVGRLILVDMESSESLGGRTVLYARVCSDDQRGDLDRQVARVTEWATRRGLSVDEVVTEVASDMTAKRRKLARVLAGPTALTVVVEHRDRLARFGVKHLEAALSAGGRRVLVADEGEVDGDLVRDMTEVLTSFCARLCGRRGARNRAEKALRCVEDDMEPMALSHPTATI